MKLNIGCGNKRLPGFIGVDRFPCAGADFVCDATRLAPLGDDSVEEVLLDNVMEHVVDVAALMAEVFRVCRPGAVVRIVTPHFSSIDSWRDPTHVHHFSYFSMDYFERPDASHYLPKGFRIDERRLSFNGNLLGLVGRFLFWLSPRRYEQRFCFLFRAGTLRFTLRVVK